MTDMTDTLTGTVADAADLYNALKTVMVFAGNDDTVPVLTAVRLESDPLTGLTLTATDRYTAGRVTLFYAGAPIDVLIGRREITAALPILKGMISGKGQNVASVAIEVGGGMVRFVGLDGSSVTVFTMEGEHPKVTHLFPTEDKPSLNTPVALDPAYLARFAKVTRAAREPMRLWFHGARSPVLVKIGENFVGLIMPVRIVGDGS